MYVYVPYTRRSIHGVPAHYCVRTLCHYIPCSSRSSLPCVVPWSAGQQQFIQNKARGIGVQRTNASSSLFRVPVFATASARSRESSCSQQANGMLAQASHSFGRIFAERQTAAPGTWRRTPSALSLAEFPPGVTSTACARRNAMIVSACLCAANQKSCCSGLAWAPIQDAGFQA